MEKYVIHSISETSIHTEPALEPMFWDHYREQWGSLKDASVYTWEELGPMLEYLGGFDCMPLQLPE